MIRTEMSRYALSMNGSVEQATDVGTREGAAMHAEAHEATRELVHDHEHPVAAEHDGLAPKEVHAPEAVRRVADERQPRRSAATRTRAIVFRQHARHDVLIDVEAERLGNDARNARTAEARIARLQLHDHADECLVWPSRPGLPGAWSR